MDEVETSSNSEPHLYIYISVIFAIRLFLFAAVMMGDADTWDKRLTRDHSAALKSKEDLTVPTRRKTKTWGSFVNKGQDSRQAGGARLFWNHEDRKLLHMQHNGGAICNGGMELQHRWRAGKSLHSALW